MQIAAWNKFQQMPLPARNEEEWMRTDIRLFRPKGIKVRRLHKAFLRYHDSNNWPLLREALKRMGRADLIGNGRQHLVPAYQPVTPAGRGMRPGGTSGDVKRPSSALRFRTQHTGLPTTGRAAMSKPTGPSSLPKRGSRR